MTSFLNRPFVAGQRPRVPLVMYNLRCANCIQFVIVAGNSQVSWQSDGLEKESRQSNKDHNVEGSPAHEHSEA